MTGEGAGMAAGLATGLAIGEMRREEEAAKGRRLEQMGRDQILIETKQPIDKAGESIAGIFSNWIYRDGRISQSGNRGYDLVYSFMVCFTVICISSAWWMLEVVTWGGDDRIRYPFTAIQTVIGFITAFGIGGLYGLVGDDYSDIDYIRLSESKKGQTIVLIKVYDNEGRRNLDEDTIMKIRERL